MNTLKSLLDLQVFICEESFGVITIQKNDGFVTAKYYDSYLPVLKDEFEYCDDFVSDVTIQELNKEFCSDLKRNWVELPEEAKKAFYLICSAVNDLTGLYH